MQGMEEDDEVEVRVSSQPLAREYLPPKILAKLYLPLLSNDTSSNTIKTVIVAGIHILPCHVRVKFSQ
jgi:hypothetical protein